MTLEITSLDQTGESMWLALHSGKPSADNEVTAFPRVNVPKSAWVETITPEREGCRTYRNTAKISFNDGPRAELAKARMFGFWSAEQGGVLLIAGESFETMTDRAVGEAIVRPQFLRGTVRLHVKSAGKAKRGKPAKHKAAKR